MMQSIPDILSSVFCARSATFPSPDARFLIFYVEDDWRMIENGYSQHYLKREGTEGQRWKIQQLHAFSVG
jgi:hypothetical protein